MRKLYPTAVGDTNMPEQTNLRREEAEGAIGSHARQQRPQLTPGVRRTGRGFIGRAKDRSLYPGP